MSQVINYRIIVNTKDESGGGTDNFVYITMHGNTGTSDKFELQGGLERKKQDAFDHEHEDIGVVTRITLDVSGDLADKWSPYSIRILRNTKSDTASEVEGWSEFVIDREIGYDPEDFSATTIVLPPIKVNPAGKPLEAEDRIIIVQFDHNPGQVSQTVMKYKETWTDIERVKVSKGYDETEGINVKASYETPDLAIGKFGAEFSKTWETKISSIRDEESEKIKQREFDWSFEADPYSYIFRLQIFKIPYSYQGYTDTAGNSAVVRKVMGEIVPVHLGDFLFIPRISDGMMDPITISELENNWLSYMSEENKNWVKNRFLDKWLAKGWVIYDPQPPETPFEMKGIVVTDALNIRENHDPKSKILGSLKRGDEVVILDIWSQTNNIWAKLKPSGHAAVAEQWSALLIGKNRYINLVDLPRE